MELTRQYRFQRVLIGFMPKEEAVQFLRGRWVVREPSDEKLEECWQKSYAAVNSLRNSRLTPEVLDIYQTCSSQLEAVTKDPLFPEAVRRNQWAFKMVEIDKLVCFQKHVDVGYSEDIARSHDFSDPSSLVGFCLSATSLVRPMARFSDHGDKLTYSVASPNIDLRVVGMAEMQEPKTKMKSLGFLVGWGSPFVQVVRLHDRFFLKNGYHRVYALRKLGITHVPCILIETDTYSDTGAARAGFFVEDLLLSPKPPIFKYFFSPRIAPKLKVRPITKVIRIKAEEITVPAGMWLPETEVSVETTSTTSASSATCTIGPADQSFTDFKVEKEGWNIYRLSDGTILKDRVLLIEANKEPGFDLAQPNYGLKLSNVILNITPAKCLVGPPSAESFSPEELSAAVVEDNISWEAIQETIGEYLTTEQARIKLKLELSKVARTSKFDSNGNPIYLVSSNHNVEVEPPYTELPQYGVASP